MKTSNMEALGRNGTLDELYYNYTVHKQTDDCMVINKFLRNIDSLELKRINPRKHLQNNQSGAYFVNYCKLSNDSLKKVMEMRIFITEEYIFKKKILFLQFRKSYLFGDGYYSGKYNQQIEIIKINNRYYQVLNKEHNSKRNDWAWFKGKELSRNPNLPPRSIK